MDSKQHWENRYNDGGNSGYGSYGEQADLKFNLITKSIQDINEIRSIVDFGCGDFSFGHRIADAYPAANYIGIDQSDVITSKNNFLYGKNRRFFQYGKRLHRSADLILCIDVLLHVLDEEDENNIIKDLRKCWKKYLVVSAFNHNGEPEPNGQAVMRKFPEELFGRPIIKELLEPKGMYLYIWKK